MHPSNTIRQSFEVAKVFGFNGMYRVYDSKRYEARVGIVIGDDTRSFFIFKHSEPHTYYSSITTAMVMRADFIEFNY